MMAPTGIWPFKDDAGHWLWIVVGEPITWEIGKPGSGFILAVPDGFVSDLASIPGYTG